MNSLDKEYQILLEYILSNGVEKKDRTGTGTKSIFGYQIRHDMKSGFPLLTTKKMAWKQIVTELLWFLRGDTNIKYLVDNGCNIWNGDAFKRFMNTSEGDPDLIWNQDQFINMIKTDDEFAKQWGELGPVYGRQWRNWDAIFDAGVDQIADLIYGLKTNPDSRRLMVNAWNVGEVSLMVLPPCHYGFQVYTRELSLDERKKLVGNKTLFLLGSEEDSYDEANIPRRAISLMWNQRSVDTFLGLPFNIASYGLLLMMIANEVNMVPDQLIGSLGDTHLYLNHIEQAKEQIGRDLTDEERYDKWFNNNYETGMERYFDVNNLPDFDDPYYEPTPKTTREPYPLPTVHVRDGIFCSSINDIILENYQSHPSIKAPLSN